MSILYLSGRISDPDPEVEKQNLLYFKVREDFWRHRFPRIYNPARHTHEGWTWEEYLAHDLLYIHRYRPILMMLRGWRYSRGARLERIFSRNLGLVILYEKELLNEYP
jgi:hypothetical protein